MDAQGLPNTRSSESLVQCGVEFRMRLPWLVEDVLSLVEKWNPYCWEQAVRGPSDLIATSQERLTLESAPGQSCWSLLCALEFVILLNSFSYVWGLWSCQFFFFAIRMLRPFNPYLFLQSQFLNSGEWRTNSPVGQN